MNNGPALVAVPDACVLYPAPVRDLLLSWAERELFSPKWSKDIQFEWMRNLLKKRPDLKKQQLQTTALAMNEAFPDAQVDEYQSFEELTELP